MSRQLGRPQRSSLEGTFDASSGSPIPLGTRRTTGKLLATQGYVVGIEISGSGARQSVALADLEGKILFRVRRPLEDIPDTKTVLEIIHDMLAEVLTPDRVRNGRVLPSDLGVGSCVDT